MYFKVYGVTLFCPNIWPVPGSQIVGKKLKKKVREKSAGREKGKRKGERAAPALPSFLQFYFDYLGIWNRLPNITITTFSAVSLTQITLKSKQEIPGLVNFTFFSLFPCFKQYG